MQALDPLIRQTQRNCDISDAHHGGVFSICSRVALDWNGRISSTALAFSNTARYSRNTWLAVFWAAGWA